MTGVLVVLVVAALAAVAAWWVPAGRHQLAAAGALVAVLAGLGAGLLLADVSPAARGAGEALLMFAGVLAVTGGGPVTTAVFSLVDRDVRRGADSVVDAGEVLRGGAWIGALERTAVYATLVWGWPEGLAVVLALKGLGRYPELRGPEQPRTASAHAVAERFIIGTLVSVLWAAGCAGLGVAAR